MKTKKLNSKAGFSLLEIIVVIVIIGILASVALPRYNVFIEKSRSAEGIQILSAVLAAQRLYRLEEVHGNFTNNITLLDIDANNTSLFEAPTASTTGASIKRDGSYTLSIDLNGVISCADGAVTICAKMGY